MKILHTGRGTAGSWKIRGEQLGEWVKPKAQLQACKNADWIVLVKKPSLYLMDRIHESGTPWVWDTVDPYPQPECSGWSRGQGVSWMKRKLEEYRPDGVIFATQRMADDCKPEIPFTVIYHHHMPNIKVNPIRQEVKTVGYQGDPKYLGKWLSYVNRECKKRGWEFIINPKALADVDIVVAFRDHPWNGYVQKHWKSNVKLANAHGSGTPFIGQKECGYTETGAGLEVCAEDEQELCDAFDSMTYEFRKEVNSTFLQASITAKQCRASLKSFIQTLQGRRQKLKSA